MYTYMHTYIVIQEDLQQTHTLSARAVVVVVVVVVVEALKTGNIGNHH